MIYTSLGKAPLRVSKIGLGTVQLGMPYGLDEAPPPPPADGVALIRQALEAGINFIDTAPAYGRSEALVGEACAGFSPPPLIATKVSVPSRRRDVDLRRHFAGALERSRRRLRRDVLDLVGLHSVGGSFVDGELLDALAHCVECGLVRCWGATTYGLQAPLEAVRHSGHFAALQVAYSALDRQLEEALFPAARQSGVGLVIRSVFLQGLLGDRFAAPPAHLRPLGEAIGRLRALAAQAGLSLSELAFRFAVFHPDVDAALFGTTSPAELEQNLDFFARGPLPADLASAVRGVQVEDTALLNPANWRPGAAESKGLPCEK